MNRPEEPENHTVAVTIAATLAVLTHWGQLYIVPKFEEMFRDMLPGKPLPALTELTIAVSRFSSSVWGLVTGIVVAFLIVPEC